MGAADLAKFENIGAYCGITCGLSAPYVAGQLVASMENGFETYLLGHNPPNQAKSAPIEKWDSTFQATVDKLANYEKGTLMTPVFGGECISGSSRMKGGSGSLKLYPASSITTPRNTYYAVHVFLACNGKNFEVGRVSRHHSRFLQGGCP